jgi:hypothetical protein
MRGYGSVFQALLCRIIFLSITRVQVNNGHPVFRQMEKSEQRFVIKVVFLKALGSKVIHRKLTIVLGSPAYSLTQIKE